MKSKSKKKKPIKIKALNPWSIITIILIIVLALLIAFDKSPSFRRLFMGNGGEGELLK